jgi:hypothetical protein
MKKHFVLLVSFLFSSFIYAQFSVSTELKYLELINTQNRTDLIKDNLKNAEFASDSIIYKGEQSSTNSQFYYQLAMTNHQNA